MAVTYSAGAKTARMNGVVTAIDAGGAAAKLEIGTAAMAAVLATISLNYNPAGTVSGSVLTLAGMPHEATASGTGTAAAARIRTSADVDVITGLTVNTSAADIIIDSTSIVAGQIVRITAGSITHA